MSRQQRRRAILSAGLGRDALRAIAWYRAEAREGRAHCVTADLAPFIYDGDPLAAAEPRR